MSITGRDLMGNTYEYKSSHQYSGFGPHRAFGSGFQHKDINDRPSGRQVVMPETKDVGDTRGEFVIDRAELDELIALVASFPGSTS